MIAGLLVGAASMTLLIAVGGWIRDRYRTAPHGKHRAP